MCGRFSLSASGEELAEAFGLSEAPSLAPRYNIAPSQPVAVVRAEPAAQRRSLSLLRWGLVPQAAPEPQKAFINARAETAGDRPSFREAFAQRRCLVPANGFYEWARAGRRREPWYFRLRSGRVFALAGLWEPSREPDAAATCTLLTTEPNELVGPIHDRMPVILAPGAYARWLDPALTGVSALRPLLVPFDGASMTAYPVGSLVNDPRRDEPACIQPTG